MKLLLSVVLVVLAAPAWPQDLVIDGPLLGYVFAPRLGGLQPLLGIPGAAQVGGMLDLGWTLSSAEVSPRQDYALAVAAPDGQILVVNLQRGRMAVRPVPGARPGADRIRLSPRGAFALLYYQESRTAELLTGLPDSPAPAGRIDLAAMPDPPEALAVSDDGLVLAAGAEFLFLLRPADAAQPLARVGRVADMRFLEQSRDAVIADEGRNELLLVRDAGGSSELRVLAGERDGISQPSAVAAFGRRVFAANRAARTVLALDASGGVASQFPCDCAPARLDPLHGPAVFRLTESGEGPIFLFDGGGEEPRIVFVPAAPVESSGPPRRRGLQ